MSAAESQDWENSDSSLGDTTREQLAAIWSIWALGTGVVASVVLGLSIVAVSAWIDLQGFTSMFCLFTAGAVGVLTGISAAAYPFLVPPGRHRHMFVLAAGATSLLAPLAAFGVILILRRAAGE